ncbi:MAG: hypothetical protein GY858_02745 [Candidatus Omnitrophica bacterium]|nr:hypothetical protein [Candidatus Omnitrophota bacterium]
MMRLIMIIVVIFTGCSTINPKMLVNPYEPLYYRGTDSFDNKDYTTAIEAYSRFLEKCPDSSFTIPAKLNLAMAYYHQEKWQLTQSTLKDVKITDSAISKFVNDTLATCEKKLNPNGSTTSEKTETQPQEEVVITITDAYLDNADMLNLTGTVSREGKIYIGQIAADFQKDNTFTIISRWRKGKPIIISWRKDGLEQTLDYYPDNEEPQAPDGLFRRNMSDNTVELEWNDNDEGDIKGYKLYYQLSGSGSLQEVRDIIEDTDFEVVGLQNLIDGANKTFRFYLRAVDKMNNYSDPSDTLEVTLP